MKRNTTIGIGVAVLAILAVFLLTRGGDKSEKKKDTVTKTDKGKRTSKRNVKRSTNAGSDFVQIDVILGRNLL